MLCAHGVSPLQVVLTIVSLPSLETPASVTYTLSFLKRLFRNLFNKTKHGFRKTILLMCLCCPMTSRLLDINFSRKRLPLHNTS